jgi:hypothetical protein
VDMMRHKTPTFARKIRSQKSGLRSILKRRGESAQVVVGTNTSDSDHDDDDVVVTEIPPSPTTPHRLSVTRGVVSNLFTKPKQNGSLAQRVRKNREVIEKVGMKRHAQGIEDSFVLSTEARRTSILANQARARRNLQKRIAKKKLISTDGEIVNHPMQIVDEQGEEDELSVEGGRNLEGKSPNPMTMNKLSSFEAFKEKKEIVKNFTAHQTLREQAREAQRREAKAALEVRKHNRKKKQSVV